MITSFFQITSNQRDASLIRSLNRELIHRYIDTEVLFYKTQLNSISTNIYDETNNKVYQQPVLIPCIVTFEDEVWSTEDYKLTLQREQKLDQLGI